MPTGALAGTADHPGPPAADDRGQRRLRADAQRNHDALLEGARVAYAAADAPVSLDAVARAAGVGIGTLYRHFPTREALVEAVYAAELDDVVSSAASLLHRLAPDAALRAWMDRYAQFTATKRGMVDVLRAGWTSGRVTTPATRARITAAIATIMAAGARNGSLRGDVDPDDVTAMLLGVFLSGAAGGTSDQSVRLLDFVVDALRSPPHR